MYASASLEDSDDDLISEQRRRVNGCDIVYTRRTSKKVKKAYDHAACTISVAQNPAVVVPALPVAESVVVADNSQYSKLENTDKGQQDASSRGGDVHQLAEQVQHELHIPSLQDGICSAQNGVDKNDALKETPDDMRPSSVREKEPSESNLPDDIELSPIPDGNNELNGELMPGLSQGEGVVDAQGLGEPLAVTSSGELIRFNLGKRSSHTEIEDLNQKLEGDLEKVRRSLKEFEAKERQIASYGVQLNDNIRSTNGSFNGSVALNTVECDHSEPLARPDFVHRRLFLRVNSEAGSTANRARQPKGLSRVNSDTGVQRNLGPRSYNRQLSVSVIETNNQLGEFAEKEKRTPKANQFYRNTEFLLGKDRLPPESNKRLKTGSGRKYVGDTEHTFTGIGFDKGRSQIFRSCSTLLQRLMKHKFGWVFNVPVDSKKLGLTDYHDIIKHPMDLGTVKVRLSQNLYKSPTEFAEDVRLVFRNAMTYNPKGQDVHFMADQLLHIFEERWAVVQTEYNNYWKHQLYKGGRLPAISTRNPPAQSYYIPSSFPASPVAGFVPSVVQPSSHVLRVPDAPQNRTSDRHEPLSILFAGEPQTQRSHFGRVPAPKKPKAKDPDKRDMTQEEKQRLSKHLQDLPSEKLDAIVEIIKKRNTALSQHDDEIEVDIDRVDPETLWELDRFVSNYKKRLSKNKRKAELALQARTAAGQNAMMASSTPTITGIQTERGDFEKSINPADGEKGGAYNESSSSSSSSDSGSSSSDSDSDTSSGDGSDAGNSPVT